MSIFIRSKVLHMLKSIKSGNTSDINSGKKGAGIYADIKPFNAGGPSAFYMTSPGSEYSPGYLVRLQFTVGTCVITFDTKGIAPEKVIPKLPEIYNIIKGNYK